jgi:predicted dithiol-disulfide oxidoreductase (DUF899 family)
VWFRTRNGSPHEPRSSLRKRSYLDSATTSADNGGNSPWEAVTKEYVFDGPAGKQTVSELFDGRSQLIIYHFMFDPSWDAGCPHCSHWADNFNSIIVHLNHRDVTMIAVSRAPFKKLAAYEKRMGWTFKWVSSFETDFNYDYHVSFTPEEMSPHVPRRERASRPSAARRFRPKRDSMHPFAYL